MKNNYARLQTIAHECIHSVQKKSLLIFNFIISSVNIWFFLILMGLTIFRVLELSPLLVTVFTGTVLIQAVVRSILEVDAMKRARILVENYIDLKLKQEPLISIDEREALLKRIRQNKRHSYPIHTRYVYH